MCNTNSAIVISIILLISTHKNVIPCLIYFKCFQYAIEKDGNREPFPPIGIKNDKGETAYKNLKGEQVAV